MEQLPDQPQLQLQGPARQREVRRLHPDVWPGRGADHTRAQSGSVRLLPLFQTGITIQETQYCNPQSPTLLELN